MLYIVWEPCNFIFFQTTKHCQHVRRPVWAPCNSIPFPIAWTPFPPSQKIWEPCNSIPPPSHKASAATQSACLRILQSPFQAGNSSAHQKNPVWVPCSFFFSKTSGSVAARVWVPCNFTFLQAFKMLKSCGSSVWVPCDFIFFQTILWCVYDPAGLIPCNFIFFQTQCATDRRQVSVWVPCNFIFFQTLKTLRVWH